MIINITVPMFLVRAYWFLNDKCDDCGGELEQHINGKYYCKNCDKLN